MALTLLHTADWHIGRTQKAVGGAIYDRLSDQANALQKLIALVEQLDPRVILLAGDLYDIPRPRAEAEKLVAEYLPQLTQAGRRLLIAIAGNHDSRTTFATYHNWARPLGILLIGTVQDTLIYDNHTAGNGHCLSSPLPGVLRIQLRDRSHPLYLYTFPHLYSIQWPQAYELPNAENAPEKNNDASSFENNPKKIKYTEAWHKIPEEFIQKEPEAYHIFVGHSFCVAGSSVEVEDTPDDEESFRAGGDERHGVEVFHPKLHYVALGHLHRPHQVGNAPVYYPGSLLWYGPHHISTPRQVIFATWESPHTEPQITFHELALEEFQPLAVKTDQESDITPLLSQPTPTRRALWLWWKSPSLLPVDILQTLAEKYYLFYHHVPEVKTSTLPTFESEESALQHLLYQRHDKLLEDFLRYKRWSEEDIQKVISYIFEKYAYTAEKT